MSLEVNSKVVYNEMRAGIISLKYNVPEASITSLFEGKKNLKSDCHVLIRIFTSRKINLIKQ
jgi:hypothetical protein